MVDTIIRNNTITKGGVSSYGLRTVTDATFFLYVLIVILFFDHEEERCGNLS